VIRFRAAIVAAVAALFAGACVCTQVAAQRTQPAGIEDSSYRADDGTRTLRQSVVVPAAVAAVWDAFTTSEGYGSWAAPLARVDFRLGGTFETSYASDARAGSPANIVNEVVAFLPLRMLALRNRQAPPDVPFDAAAFQALHTIVLFDDLGGARTRVTVAMPGVRSDDAHERILRFFEWGNATTLAALRDRFAKGPTEWQRRP
jgi:uncharacterized protein YndB with AHSA1/START domain